ncbi:MAG: hypothetical protein QHH43_08715 [Candidatus Saccharicenans sp.]|jgi:hypothetical protein|nr:hypothetical protein [Candidatus Saccharicenans sp.]MDH7575822.1 hypothetical protein [Candidatus Saccharicenans sp.]
MTIKIKKKTFIFIIALALVIGAFAYLGILEMLDKTLVRRAELLKAGMTESDVVNILGKPREFELIDLRVAENRGLPKAILSRIEKYNQAIKWWAYYVPGYLVNPPFLFHPGPYRTIVVVFIDHNGHVVHSSIGITIRRIKPFELLMKDRDTNQN